MKKGNLYLIPIPIADGTEQKVMPPMVLEQLKSIHHFLVENVRTARRYLSSLRIYSSIETLSFDVLNKDTPSKDIDALLGPALEGYDLGILSESGCPGIADPGAMAVASAHEKGIPVIPLVGPSSILLALMASGLNGQKFAFHGYLPVNKQEAATEIRQLELESRKKNQTQIFIETPYRNNALFENLVRTLAGTTVLCVAMDMTGSQETISTKTVSAWGKGSRAWPKLPAVFLFLAR